MATGSLDGDDPGHDLTEEEKDSLESALRKEAVRFLAAGKPKLRRERLNRATNISREPSRRADHH
jgi:hypothetical protein